MHSSLESEETYCIARIQLCIQNIFIIYTCVGLVKSWDFCAQNWDAGILYHKEG